MYTLWPQLAHEISYVSVKFQKNAGQIGEKLKPQDTERTRLQELSLMNSTHFGAIHYDIHLDMKLDYTIRRLFQEMSLSELETLHQLCELERTQILQSLALAVLKISYAGYYPEIDQISLIMKAKFYGITLVPRKYHPYTFLNINDVKKNPNIL